MAPKAKARSAAPKAPAVPAPPSLRVETLDPEQGLPPDWLQRHLHGHYSRQKKQATAASQAIEEALARGDYATAERLDAELEQFYETVENQLQDLDEADPAAAEKGDDETSFGPGSPSVSEQVRDIYGKYLRGELADDFEDVGGQLVRPDQPGGFLPPGAMVLQGSERVPLTPEQALARRLRSVFGGDGFTATGDDLNITGENYNPRGRADALRGISQLPDAQINDMAKDLYAAHEEVKARQRGGGGQSQALVRFLSKHGAYAIPLLASMQQDEAQAAKPGRVLVPLDPRAPYQTPLSLKEAMEAAADQGVPYGYDIAEGKWDRLLPSAVAKDILLRSDSGNLIAELQRRLESQGIPGGQVVPLSKGAYSTVFASPETGEVVKFTLDGPGQYADANTAGVWGGPPSARVVDQLQPVSRPSVTYAIYPQAILGKATQGDLKTLMDGLGEQGWKLHDDHLGNIGMLPGAEYRPVALESNDVRPLQVGEYNPTRQRRALADDTYAAPFVPPRGPRYDTSGLPLGYELPYNPSHLALLAAVAQSRRAMESQGIQPEGPSAGVESPAGMKLLGNAPGVNQLMVTGGSAPPAPGRSQLLPPVPPPSGVLEQFTGSDFSQKSVSPREVDRFYTDPAYGRGGDVHRAYIAQAEQLLDQPLIPAGWAVQRFGKDAVAAVGGDGDLSVRQVLAMAPRLELEQAVTAIKSSPKGSPEYNDAVAKIARVKDYAKTNFLAVTRGEDGRATVNMADPYVQQTWGFLTGQNPAYDSSFGKETAGLVLQGIQSGVTGGAFENDPTMSDEDFAALKERYGEKANRMLTPGGVANAKREAAFDFLSALHDDPGMNPHIDNFSILMNGVPSRKFEQLADSSAYRGRMGMALDRFRNASAQFEEHEKHGDWRGPFEVQAQNVNRLDPGSFSGVLNLMGSSSWGYGRNVGNPFRQTFDEALTRPGMQDYAFDGRPGDFFRDIRDRTSRETPIRLPGQTYEQNLGTREFARRREEANADYIPTFFPAAIADGINAGRRKFAELVAGPGEPTEKLELANRNPTNAMAAVSSFPRSIAASPIQMAMVAPGVGAGALKVASGGLKAAPAGAAKAAGGLGLASGVEVGQELVENTAQDPNALSGLLDYRAYSPYLGKRNVDANDRPKWDKAVKETQAELEGDLRKNYRDWLYRTGNR